jgi:hypothetical protein
MPEPPAGHIVKTALQRTHRLLFPFRPLCWLGLSTGLPLISRGHDLEKAELNRLKPYYRGTRLLARSSFLLVAIAFLLPFSVAYVGMEGFYRLLVAYVLVLVIATLAGIVLEVVLDAIFAIQHDRKMAFGQAVRAFSAMLKTKTSQVVEYMAIKLVADMVVMGAVLAFFLPAILTAMWLMLYLVDAVKAGVDARADATYGLLLVMVLALLGFLAMTLTTLMASAFYGYYTEEAVRLMQDTCPEA